MNFLERMENKNNKIMRCSEKWKNQGGISIVHDIVVK